MTKTYTIDDLMDMYDVFPGQLKITHPAWTEDMWFAPYYKSMDEWHGLDEVGCSHVTDRMGGWKIYIEPKKKKLVKHWLCYHKDTLKLHTQLLSQHAIDTYIPQTLVRIPGTEVEIVVDE